ncbi:hypothetical protein BJ508DRAFT_79886 [Ascobolus immersus RN42]|uniref:Uncharacterized protein n=1 Tax=Ascobolus immersus RN42 TaxID=1160509 RepID=A0A3N4HJF4_ASCIM|nr:hypothetical protein BJ508DRAFT_79886 [Ascobolus immersus RN42]
MSASFLNRLHVPKSFNLMHMLSTSFYRIFVPLSPLYSILAVRSGCTFSFLMILCPCMMFRA